MNWLSRNWLGVVVSIALLIGAFSAFYYFVLFLPEEHRAKLELEREKQTAELQRQATEQKSKDEAQKQNQRFLNACLDDAGHNYNANWKIKCEYLKLDENCHLPEYIAKGLTDDFVAEQERCYNHFSPR